VAVCRICLRTTRGRGVSHSKCLQSLFGVPRSPTVDFDLAGLHAIALEMAGRMSISGVQRKVSVKLTPDGSKIEPASQKGRFILKPQGAFPFVPENEHLTMKLASVVGINTPPCGLVQLKDNTLAYIIKRFDRTDTGTKLRQEDFCQLAKKPPKDKYDASAELCVRLLRKYATEPLIEIRKLYKLMLFNWWSYNMDMHLKNFSLLEDTNGNFTLSPAYDQLCTYLAIPDEALALPMNGRDKRITKRQWLKFARYCEIPVRAAESMIAEQRRALEPSLKLIAKSFLPEDMKAKYNNLIMSRHLILSV
jgi:serine/threonine-protein kinase HipA